MVNFSRIIPTNAQSKALQSITLAFDLYSKSTRGRFFNFDLFKRLSVNKSSKFFYLYGSTGTGKTTITSMFFEQIEESGINMHFHDYFFDISKMLMSMSIDQIAAKISKEKSVLCFDEFVVDSIADGRILFDLLQSLLSCGCFVVLTSNFSPNDLYKNGFNREVLFPAFSEFLHKNFEVLEIKSEKDFRTDEAQEKELMHFTDSNLFDEKIAFFQNIDEYKGDIFYNEMKSSARSKICVFDFAFLLKRYLSIREIIDIARGYHLVCVKDIPIFTNKNEDDAIRFRNLIDILYLRNINIITHSSVAQDRDNLFGRDLLSSFEFARCLSRLRQMEWKSYIYSDEKAKKRKWADDARSFLLSLTQAIR